MATILVVDDESGIRSFLAEALSDDGHEVEQAGDAAEALRRLEDGPFDLLITDLRMPGEQGGLDVVRRARAEWPEMQVVVLTAHGTIDGAVEAMRLGAFDFLEKPIAGPAELRRLATRALNWRGSGWARRSGAAAPAGDTASGGAEGARGSTASGAPSLLGRFLWQLKRRQVYNVSATYAAVCFIALQTAELILPALPMPGWSYRVLVGLVLAGFPVAVVLGWVYDLTAAGLRRTAAVASRGS